MKIDTRINRNTQPAVRRAGTKNSPATLFTTLSFSIRRSSCNSNKFLSAVFAAKLHILTAARITIKLKKTRVELLDRPDTTATSKELVKAVRKNDMARVSTYTQHR